MASGDAPRPAGRTLQQRPHLCPALTLLCRGLHPHLPLHGPPPTPAPAATVSPETAAPGQHFCRPETRPVTPRLPARAGKAATGARGKQDGVGEAPALSPQRSPQNWDPGSLLLNGRRAPLAPSLPPPAQGEPEASGARKERAPAPGLTPRRGLTPLPPTPTALPALPSASQEAARPHTPARPPTPPAQRGATGPATSPHRDTHRDRDRHRHAHRPRPSRKRPAAPAGRSLDRCRSFTGPCAPARPSLPRLRSGRRAFPVARPRGGRLLPPDPRPSPAAPRLQHRVRFQSLWRLLR